MKKFFKRLSLISLFFSLLTNFMYAQTDSTEVASIYGFYSYSSSLVNASSASELTIQGNASHTSTGVQLTPASSGQFGGLFINGRTFTSVNGLHVEFEYDMKNGTPFSGTYGDGLSFFLPTVPTLLRRQTRSGRQTLPPYLGLLRRHHPHHRRLVLFCFC